MRSIFFSPFLLCIEVSNYIYEHQEVNTDYVQGMTKQLKMSVIYIYIHQLCGPGFKLWYAIRGKSIKTLITAKDFSVKKCPNHLANPVNSLRWTGKKKLKDDTFEMPLTTLTFLKK